MVTCFLFYKIYLFHYDSRKALCFIAVLLTISLHDY